MFKYGICIQTAWFPPVKQPKKSESNYFELLKWTINRKKKKHISGLLVTLQLYLHRFKKVRNLLIFNSICGPLVVAEVMNSLKNINEKHNQDCFIFYHSQNNW